MTKVSAQMSISLDGCYAGRRHDGPATWMDSDEAAAFFRLTRWAVDARAWRERQGVEGGDESVHSRLIEQAFEAAGAYVMGRRMADGGGTLLRQAIERGLVDELGLHVVPVVIGTGMRLLDLDLPSKQGLELARDRVIDTPEVLHLRYRVAGRERLTLDDRG